MNILVRADEIMPNLWSDWYYVIKFDIVDYGVQRFIDDSYQMVYRSSSNDEIKLTVRNVWSRLVQQQSTKKYLGKSKVQIADNLRTLFAINDDKLKDQAIQWLSEIKAMFNGFYDPIAHAEFKIYNVNFGSTYKTPCSLMTYHDTQLGHGCPYVGFFGSGFDEGEYATFMTGRRSLCFYNTSIVDPNNERFMRIARGDEYFGIFNNPGIKDIEYGLFKLDIAYATERETKNIVQIDPRLLPPDEYIIVSNRHIPMCVMTNFESNSVTQFNFAKQFMEGLATGRVYLGDNRVISNAVVGLCHQGRCPEVRMDPQSNVFNGINYLLKHVGNNSAYNAH